MVLEPGKSEAMSFRGEVVEIFERKGKRMAKITLDARDMLDVAAESIDDAHLGDKVVLDVRITIESIKAE